MSLGPLAALLVELLAPSPSAPPLIPVRYPEGVAHGFLALRSTTGDVLAEGALLQTKRGNEVTSHFVVHPELGGITGLIAPLVGKEPPDLHIWILFGDVPAFMGFEGSLFMGGPTWRIELASPRWPESAHERPAAK